MIDWSTAERIAGLVAGTPASGRPRAADLASLAVESEQRVTDYSGLAPLSGLPRPEAVSRREWIHANLDTMRPLLDPVSEGLGEGLGMLAGPVRMVAGTLIAAQVGALTGYLSQRVLGQYEVALLASDPAPRLLFVAPNLEEAAAKLNAPHSDLLRWVAFHEVTHAVQFAAVPWLREHLGGMLRELLTSLSVSIDGAAARSLPRRPDAQALLAALREGDLISLVLGEDRRRLVDRMQATMAVVEGHAEHVMDAVGDQVLPSARSMREAFERRRDARSGPLRVIDRLLGLELKLRQYRDGKRFCDTVIERGGIEALNRVWASAEAIPTLRELADPGSWMTRTAVPSVTS